MLRELFTDLLLQNQVSCHFAFSELTAGNLHYRLTDEAASAGFIYRHIGETMNLFGYFFGFPTDVPNTTMGQPDTGQGEDLAESRRLVEKGYALLRTIIEQTADAEWQNAIDTPFFGSVTRARLFAHVLYHTAYHAGQIGLTLKKGGTPTRHRL
ncbi:hypothetical protein GCM10023189_39310 [Nibrella saemangeumensis]|uniref:DinB-like domain-containing protein n=1 Tax=Nibrella saemangeumensis TaxID=1084526 RepID=A0ABP8NB56_9BACT